MINNRKKNAVSEIVGTILLLSIAISLTTVVYIFVVNQSMNNSNNQSSNTLIVGSIENQGTEVLLEHMGGEGLSLNAKIYFTIAGDRESFLADDLIENDKNGNGIWDIGERCILDQDVRYLQVEVVIVDPVSNQFVMKGVLQTGDLGVNPIVITNGTEDVTSYSAYIRLHYDFRDHPGPIRQVRFKWKEIGGSWQETDWQDTSGGKGDYQEKLTNLKTNTIYNFYGQLKYNKTGDAADEIIINGYKNSFTTRDIRRGIWHFDTGSGIIAYDSSEYKNHGNIYNGASWVNVTNGSSLSLDGINDYVEVVDDDNDLDITGNITIETWVKPSDYSEGYMGNIKKQNLDVSAFNLYDLDGFEPDIVHVINDIYAVVVRSSSRHGYLVTVKIENDGQIIYNDTTCIVDHYEFETSIYKCIYPKIIKIDSTSDIFAIVYRTDSNSANTIGKGKIRTVQISSDGSISDTGYSLIFESEQCTKPKITFVNGDIYSIAYSDDKEESGSKRMHGKVATVEILSDGSLNSLNNMDFYVDNPYVCSPDDSYCQLGRMWDPDPILIEWNSTTNTGLVAIVYQDYDDDLSIRVVEIDETGQIEQITQYIDSSTSYPIYDIKIDSYSGYEPDIIQIGQYAAYRNYAISYGGRKHDSGDAPPLFSWEKIAGQIICIRIYNNGIVDSDPSDHSAIILGSGHEYEYETDTLFRDSSIVHLSSINYAIFYNLKNNVGYVKTIDISSTGLIGSVIQTLQFESQSNCNEPEVINVNANIYSVIYRWSGDTSVLKTVEISGSGTFPADEPIIDAHEIGTFYCGRPEIIPVNNNIYAITYNGLDSGGWIKTIMINSNGEISDTFIDTFTIERGRLSSTSYQNSQYCYYPDLIYTGNNIYAIPYYGPNTDLWIVTVYIDSNGFITEKDKKQLLSFGQFPDIYHITNDVYAISCEGPSYNGYIVTITISSDGIVTFKDSYAYFGGSGNIEESSISIVDWNSTLNTGVYAIAFTSNSESNHGRLTTLGIYANGTIIKNIIDSKLFADNRGFSPKIIKVDDFVFAISYRGPDDYGWLKTGTISKEGIIGDVTDTLEFDNSYSLNPDIINVFGRVYAVAYCGPGSDGWIKTFRIGSNGEMSDEVEDEHEFDPSRGDFPEIINIKQDLVNNSFTYAIIYRGPLNYELTIATTMINLSSTVNGIFVKEGSYNISANATHVIAKINNSCILSYPLNSTSDWNHIAITYNQSVFILYIDGIPVRTNNYSNPIAETTSNLIFGRYSSTIDEFILYDQALSGGFIWERYLSNKPE